QVRRHGLGQGVIRAFAGDALGQAFGGVVRQRPHRFGVTQRIVVDGAGDGRLEQGEIVVPGPAGLTQQVDRLVARQVAPLPNATTPRRWRGTRPGASATTSMRNTWPAKLGLWRNTDRPAASRRSYWSGPSAIRADSRVARR